MKLFSKMTRAAAIAASAMVATPIFADGGTLVIESTQVPRHLSGGAIILITHDMGAISEMADTVAVMHAGRVIEEGSADDVLDHPQHPYTRGLIDCTPAMAKANNMGELAEIPGVVPPLHLLGAGSAFAGRCGHANQRCTNVKPVLTTAGHHPAASFGVEEARL